MKHQQISGWVNPLIFMEADETLSAITKTPLTAEAILKFLSQPDENLDNEIILSRYREIDKEPVTLFIAPVEQRILEKLIWPLRHAKASYMVGNYLSTIALSGMIAEMVCMLLWELSPSKINDRSMTKDDEKKLFGSEFEKLGQDRRVSVLSAYAVITIETKNHFDIIRTTRKKYLHLWSQDHDHLSGDAIKCYHAAISLVVNVLGQDIQDGKLLLNPQLLIYLERKGLYNPIE